MQRTSEKKSRAERVVTWPSLSSIPLLPGLTSPDLIKMHGARFVHVRFICVEPQSSKKKKQQLSNGCPAYIVLEYSETLDRLVIKEQNSNHIHVALQDSQIRKQTSSVHDSTVLSTSSLQKLPSKGLRRKFSQVIKKSPSNRIPRTLQDSEIDKRTTTVLQASTAQVNTSLPKNQTTKRHAQKTLLAHSLIKRCKNSCVHADLKDSKTNTTPTSPLQMLTRNKLRQKPAVDNPANEEQNDCNSGMHADLNDYRINTRSRTSSSQKLTMKTLQHKPLVNSLANEVNNRSHRSIHTDMQDSEHNRIAGTNPHQNLANKALQQKPPGDDLLNEDQSRRVLNKNTRKSKIGDVSLSHLQVTKPRPANSLPQEPQRKQLLTLPMEITCDELAIKNTSSPVEAHTVSLACKENISGPGLERISEVIKDVMQVDMGSLASFSVDSSENLNRLSIQTSRMRLLFTKFPESLLLHRVQSNSGHVLYAFLVESKERVGKVVHFTVLNEDTAENVSKMLSAFALFNPEYNKVKVIFIDISFVHKSALKETFPTAQALLSVYHTVRLIEKKVRKLSAFKAHMETALRDVVFSTSAQNLISLSQMLKNVLDPDFHQFLQTHWFSSEMLWYMHVKKGLHSCSTYMDTLQVITRKIKSLFSKQTTLETSILYVLEHADCFNSKGLEKLNQSTFKSTHEIVKKVNKEAPANLALPALVTPARVTSLPTPAMLLPKLAQILPKLGILRPPKLQSMQAKPSVGQAQPDPKLVCSPSISQGPLLAQPPPVLSQQCPVQPQPVLPLSSCPQTVLAQAPPILSRSPPVQSQLQATENLLRCTLAMLQSARPEQLQLSKSALARPTHERSLQVPKTESQLPKVELLLSEPEPLLSKFDLLVPFTNPSVVTFSNCPLQNISKDEDFILVVLQKLCTDVAYQLCLGEWNVVKKSRQVVEVNSTRMVVRLLEDVQKVSKDCHTCDCYFNSRYRLPCRHILTILHKNKRPVEEDMICHRWQRKYQQQQLTEDDILARVRCSSVSQKEGDERFTRMKSLSKELGNLLLQCEGTEFKERCFTLHTLIDSWDRQRKQEDVHMGTLTNVGDLPFLWVKREKPEALCS